MIRLLLLASICTFSSGAGALETPSPERAEFDRIWVNYAEYVQSGDVGKSLAEAHRGFERGDAPDPARRYSDQRLSESAANWCNLRVRAE